MLKCRIIDKIILELIILTLINRRNAMNMCSLMGMGRNRLSNFGLMSSKLISPADGLCCRSGITVITINQSIYTAKSQGYSLFLML